MKQTEAIAEEWRPIPGYEGRYDVSTLGHIRSLRRGGPGYNVPLKTPIVIKPQTRTTGYWFISFNDGKQFSWSRLVCTIFHGPPPSAKHHAAHLDGNPINNVPGNLAWVTPSENEQHKRLHGTYREGSKNCLAKLTEEQVREIKAAPLVNRGHNTRLARRYKVSPSTIWAIRSGKKWKHVTDQPTERKP